MRAKVNSLSLRGGELAFARDRGWFFDCAAKSGGLTAHPSFRDRIGCRLMRTIQRACVLVGLALSASLGVVCPAFAADGPAAHGPDPSSIHAQAQHSGTVQTNITVSPVNQVSVGSDGDQSALNWAQQHNSSVSDQDAGQAQGEG
jgi:hypothetical protein